MKEFVKVEENQERLAELLWHRLDQLAVQYDVEVMIVFQGIKSISQASGR